MLAIMGQVLSSPVVEKQLESGGDEFTAYGLCAMQGWRVSMEDAHINETDLSVKDQKLAFYGIFDGHGGSAVAEFCQQHMTGILENAFGEDNRLPQILIQAFIAMDKELSTNEQLQNDSSGCTATTVVVAPGKLICANAGDSRCVLSRKGTAKALSYDHKPALESERGRIMAAGGYVQMDRVNGNLALSRALGDFEYKSNEDLCPHEQIVSCVPDITEHVLDYESDEFVILACDGIWDCLTSQECVDLVQYGLHSETGPKDLQTLASLIIDVCCAPNSGGSGIGCDNMSITIVALLRENEGLDQWFERMKAKPIAQDRQLMSFKQRRKEIYGSNLFENPESDDSVFAVTRTPTSKPKDSKNKKVRASGMDPTLELLMSMGLQRSQITNLDV